jgi:hypothetical protein
VTISKGNRPLWACIASEAIYLGVDAACERHDKTRAEILQIIREVDADPAARRMQLSHIARLKPRWEASVVGASEAMAMATHDLARHVRSTLEDVDRAIAETTLPEERARLLLGKAQQVSALIGEISRANATTSELMIRRELISARIAQLREGSGGGGPVLGIQAPQETTQAYDHASAPDPVAPGPDEDSE